MPVAREDGLPWTLIRIEEGATDDGPWTLIDTLNMTPLDSDPSQPMARSFTTTLATLTEGWYRVSFRDAAAHIAYSIPIHNVSPNAAPWTPSLSDIGLLILSRTRDKYGNLAGTFTAETEPTEEQAVRIAQKAAVDMADAMGDDIPEKLWDDAAEVVAKKAAMIIELSYYSDQVNTDRSIYPQLEKEYELQLANLQRAITLFKEGETDVTTSGVAKKASWGFRDPSTSLGFNTCW